MLLKILYITWAVAAGFYTSTLLGIDPWTYPRTDSDHLLFIIVFGYWLLFGLSSTIAVLRFSKNGKKLWGKILLWPLYYWFKEE